MILWWQLSGACTQWWANKGSPWGKGQRGTSIHTWRRLLSQAPSVLTVNPNSSPNFRTVNCPSIKWHPHWLPSRPDFPAEVSRVFVIWRSQTLTKHSSGTCQVNLIAHTASLRQVIPRTSSPGVSITDRLERDSTLLKLWHRDAIPVAFLTASPKGDPGHDRF